MSLISLHDVGVAFGDPPLLQGMSLQVEKGEKIALIGRNGEGKSTLLRLIAGRQTPDSGRVSLHKGSRIAALDQDLPQGLTGTVHAVAGGGLDGGTVADGSRAANADDSGPEAAQMVEDHRVAAVLTRLGLDPAARFENLSVGFKRRTLLARALVRDPDLLLLDEPTNHLDIATIAWLEEYLQAYRGTLMFITHDRVFLRKLATRILELDRGRLTSWACDYRTFLERREAAQEAEEAEQARFLRKLAKEEAWIRQGVKARRTRNEGRVRALQQMRREQQSLRARTGSVQFQIEEARRTGKLVIEAEGIHHAYDARPVIDNFSVRIMRGDRIGIIGPNGIGKTTLLRILLGELPPQQGRVRLGTHLQPVYFDQLRAQLDEDRTVQDNIADGEELLDLGGARRHVIGYLKDFLFSPDRARSPVRVLSGGERNRLLLARLFLKPSNLLVLDEPTNDLDMETLELLEDRLLEYRGTILLVSHDRAFLNGAVTSTLVFEGGGSIVEYAGGYDDWLVQRPQAAPAPVPTRTPVSRPVEKKARPRKLTFNETRELEALPQRIEALEAEQNALVERMAQPDFYKQEGDKVGLARARMDDLAQALEEAYARWQALESIREGG